jgi:uncharacterized membrane protein
MKVLKNMAILTATFILALSAAKFVINFDREIVDIPKKVVMIFTPLGRANMAECMLVRVRKTIG